MASAASYFVRAVNAAGESGNSNEISVTLPPPAPTGLVATTGALGEVDLTWDAANGATTYGVYAAEAAGGPYTLLGNVASPGANVSELDSGTTYYFVVDAANSGGSSGFSNEDSAVAG